jgi:hypothetical protein
MALLKAEAEKLSREELVRGVIEEILTKDSLFNLLPFVKTEGKAYVYNRENTISEGDFLDPNDTVNEGAATFTEITTKLRILAGDVDVDKFLIETMGDTSDQLATQIGLKAKALARKFQKTVAIGDNGTNAKEFDGLAKLVTSAQTLAVATNGGSFTLSMLDQLLDQVPNGADAIFMRSGTIRAYKDLLRTVGGGTDAAMLQLPNFSAPVLAHSGVPILAFDWLPGNETQGSSSVCTSIYAARLNEQDGLHAIYGGASAGIRVEDVGTVQNKDAYRIRLKWYSGLALKSTLSLARLKGVTNI